MRTNLLLFGALCAALALSTMVSGGDGDKDVTEGASYIGAAKCKKCHMKQHRSWRKMKHAKAWDVLKDEHKTMDAKDDKGQQCISCHVTGWGQGDRGGFKDPAASKHLLGVQCENCHGAGSKHAVAGKAVLDAKKKKFDEGAKTFIRKSTENCAKCHNPHINHKKYAKAAPG